MLGWGNRFMMKPPEVGGFVSLRGRRWLVDEVRAGPGDHEVDLSCIDDDASGEQLSVLWRAEISPVHLGDEQWTGFGADGGDDPEVFAAYLKTIEWRTATAAQRDLFQAPFRAGIRLDAYQLAPLAKALRLPRVNLLIADDVGLGKTVEAGLVLRELLLRRRANFVVVAAPPSMVLQWRDEMEAKFGLTFDIIDRDRLAAIRREEGFFANPWATGSRFIISHRLLAEESYRAGLRDLLGNLAHRSLLILDEAHHAAPSTGSKYAVDTAFTKAVRDIADRFEHRLFLSATPHNGHPNSFSTLLALLDPQRFTRGVNVDQRDLEPIMVRRLKSDLRALGERFPERVIEPIKLSGLPNETPELVLASMLAEYGDLRGSRGPTATAAAIDLLVFTRLQQRLLSSVAAFAKTLGAHKRGLERGVDAWAQGAAVTTDLPFEERADDADDGTEVDDVEKAENLADEDTERLEESLAAAFAAEVPVDLKARSLELVSRMLEIAQGSATKPDARSTWLAEWVRGNLLNGSQWNERRLIIFTEYEDTRRWLERRLREAIYDTDQADDRIAIFTGVTTLERREEIKRRFNADPMEEPLRILICTDAAREGINLQTRCYDLVHFDLPWNPARLEQRNGRIDRKLQPAEKVFCRYFVYEQRPEDVVLDALVRKTQIIHEQLGSFGQVIADQVAKTLKDRGIVRAQVQNTANDILTTDDVRAATAQTELDDAMEKRRKRIEAEIDMVRRQLERSKKSVGVEAEDLEHVVGISLSRAGAALDKKKAREVGPTSVYPLDPSAGEFAKDASWQSVFDDLRVRRRAKSERIAEWRSRVPLRDISFEPAILPDGGDPTDVVQVHLEHRLVRRLLQRFLSQGFQSGLSRACVIHSSGHQPRIVMIGRVALYGPQAARLHEELIEVTAQWTEADRGTRPLKALGQRGEQTTLAQLKADLKEARRPPPSVVENALRYVERDAQDLALALRERAADAVAEARKDLAKRGDEEARSMLDLLSRQRDRLVAEDKNFDDRQLELFQEHELEAQQRKNDRLSWRRRLEQLSTEIEEEPKRVREGFEVRAERIEPIGLVYLWPRTG